jgi:DNA-binding PadR family transcriptional regulator
VKLTPASYLMLGMMRLGVSSGYAIKKAADVSTRFFWPISLAQVYPELARLARNGYADRREDPHKARKRSFYTPTEAGHAALLAWLRSPLEANTQFRDEGILRLFFADMLTPEEQLELIDRLRARAQKASDQIRAEILPVAQTLEQNGIRHPALVAQLGADTYAYVETWLAALHDSVRGGDGRETGSRPHG